MVRSSRLTALLACVASAAACSADSDLPSTGPQFSVGTAVVGDCVVSDIKQAANQLLPTGAKQIANDSANAIQGAGENTEIATNAGFGILNLVATYGPANPEVGSTLANATLRCMNVGPVTLPIDFTRALGPLGALAGRGGPANPSIDDSAVVSGDDLWGIEPPFVGPTKQTWNQITTTIVPVPFGSLTDERILVYGAPNDLTEEEFTLEDLVGSVYDWATVPDATFSPGVVVGTCIVDDGPPLLIQHEALAQDGEIVPGAVPTFCPLSLGLIDRDEGWSPFSLARRLLRLVSPEPLLASAVGKTPPGGSLGSLSPSGAVNPGQLTTEFLGDIADGSKKNDLVFKDRSDVTVRVTPDGETPLNGAIVELIARTNSGFTVVPTGNTAPTVDGIATFPDLRVNKPGGYRMEARIQGFGQTTAADFQIVNDISNLFNIKQ